MLQLGRDNKHNLYKLKNTLKIMPKRLSSQDLQRILDTPRVFDHEEEQLDEDLLIEQSDGSRACLNWELAGQGYSIIDTNGAKKKYN
jgi:hypothetical protein